MIAYEGIGCRVACPLMRACLLMTTSERGNERRPVEERHPRVVLIVEGHHMLMSYQLVVLEKWWVFLAHVLLIE